MKQETKRIAWLDALRGLAMFFVVLGHSVPSKGSSIRKYVYSFHMPLFFFISGCTYKDTNLSLKEYTKKKAKSLVLPYIVLNISLLIIEFILSKLGIIEKISLLKSFLGIFYCHGKVLPIPCGPSWFLLALFLTEILFYILKKYTKDDVELFISTMVFALIGYVNGLSQYKISEPWHLSSIFFGVFFYFLGYIFIKNIDKIKELSNKKFKLFISGGLLGVISVLTAFNNQRISMNSSNYGSIILFLIGCISSILGYIILSKLILEKIPIFKSIGQKTIFLIGYHGLLLTILKQYVPILDKNDIYRCLLALIVTLALYLISIPVYKYAPILVGKIDKKK